MSARVLLAALLAGWLADQLARPDRDVEAGIEAYEAGELEAALERFDAAIARHGDRPELSLDRGLVLLAQGLRAASDPEAAAQDGHADAARRAFERASESDDPEVRASAFYERGNVAFDAKDWDAAIEAYVECLKARPDHANAKWNLELARLRKKEQEKEEEEEEDEDDDTGGSSGDDTGGSSGDDTGGSSGDDTGGSSGDDTGGSSGDDTGGSSGDGGSGDEGGSSGQPPEQGSSGGDQGGSGEPENQDDAEPPPPPQPAPLDQMDLEKALEELDEQDQFILDRPAGGMRPPKEDW